ncbi:MAG: apolipoprotein N-acyltransferase [Bacteroidetes bacterium]|nr:apolipoprotein N-acyltransferase [Bacteroidota bacterium]MBU1422502.1 apolipoprotein N-acyltransferase [Bacteroidota bacterium]MBU2471200.1 apolipoprotein N-acyltransferase [Bacteroidota bacterium]
MNHKLIKFSLLILSGVLFGLSFPPFQTGFLAAFAFVPFFLVFSDVESYGKALRYSYLTFFVFNLIAISWVGGFVHGKDPYLMSAGVTLLLVHPIFLSVPVLVFIFIRRSFNFKAALLTFPFLWVSFEFLHSLSDLAFPWLTLGNTQTYDISIIQYASFTGVYGVSFWLIVLNILFFILLVKLNLREWKWFSKQSVAFVIIILLLYIIPKIHGMIILNSEEDNSHYESVKVAIIQPDIDPWEKWEAGSEESQLDMYQEMTGHIAQNVDLVLWAETAVPYYVMLPQYENYFQKIKQQVDSLNFVLLTGIPDIYYYKTGDKIPLSAKKARYSDDRYDSYNSSMLLIPHSNEIQKYAKIRLVPFSERVPYADALNFLSFPEWGVGIGGWGIGKDTVVFRLPLRDTTTVKFSNMICYESIYPTFVANFVRKGAEFLTIITNDSWWGDTYGAYQHMQYAIFRSIENRRWIARCANGGISCFIDPYGRVYEQTKMLTTATINFEIKARTELTYYTRNGDVFSKFCLMISGFLIMAGLSQKFYKYVRRKNEIY